MSVSQLGALGTLHSIFSGERLNADNSDAQASLADFRKWDPQKTAEALGPGGWFGAHRGLSTPPSSIADSHSVKLS